jgi:hypothetical protein
VGGHLHGHRRVAGGPHAGELGLQVGGLRGGARARQGADDAGVDAAGAQDRGHELGHRGLAVGAGDADHGEVGRGVVPELGGEGRHGRSGVAHLELDDVEREPVLDQQGHGAGFDGGVSEAVAVGPLPGDAAEQRAGPDVAGVVDDVGDDDIGAAVHPYVDAGVGERGEEPCQWHGPSLARRGRWRRRSLSHARRRRPSRWRHRLVAWLVVTPGSSWR